jgi:DNA processing protein
VTDPELEARVIRLAATPAVTPAMVRRSIAARLDDGLPVMVEDVVADLETALGPRLADREAAAEACDKLTATGAVLLLAGHPGYPRRLGDAWPELGAPPWVFLRRLGTRALPDAPAVAVVGTRQPTLDGERTAQRIARLCARAGVVVVSGLARGIDQAAHRGALDAGGLTVAVLGTGFAVDYPHGDGALRDQIAASGGLVTELLPGIPPRPRNFPWRNRVLSGLADATVVVEARERSGALQTARLAAAQGREVLAVPGSLSQPTARGPLDLIRDGAQPVTRLEDVLEVLGVEAGGESPRPIARPPPLSDAAAAVLRLLGPVPASADDLAAALARPVPDILTAAAELSTHGLANATPRGLTARG